MGADCRGRMRRGVGARQGPGPAGEAFRSGAVALLELLLAATGAGIVAPDFLQRVAHRFLVVMVAVRAVHVTVIVVMIVVVVAVGAVDVGLLSHEAHSGM